MCKQNQTWPRTTLIPKDKLLETAAESPRVKATSPQLLIPGAEKGKPGEGGLSAEFLQLHRLFSLSGWKKNSDKNNKKTKGSFLPCLQGKLAFRIGSPSI